MEDSDMKAIREIANGMEYVASEAVDKASYDVTRNARITKVYYDEFEAFFIIGYDISVPSITDGKGFSEYINNHLRNEIYQKSKSRG